LSSFSFSSFFFSCITIGGSGICDGIVDRVATETTGPPGVVTKKY